MQPKFVFKITAALFTCLFKDVQQLFFPAFLWIIDNGIYNFYGGECLDVSPYLAGIVFIFTTEYGVQVICHQLPCMNNQSLILLAEANAV